MFIVQATYADLANRLYASPEVSGSARVSKPKLSQTGFSIEHYAGPVTYKTDYFLPKNRDFVVAEHQNLLQASSQGFVQLLFPPEAEANGNAVRKPTPFCHTFTGQSNCTGGRRHINGRARRMVLMCWSMGCGEITSCD